MAHLHDAGMAVTIESFLDAFLAAAGRSKHTARAYRSDLLAYAAFVKAPNTDIACRNLLEGGLGPANHQVLTYQRALRESGQAPATVNRKLAVVRSMVKMARMFGLVEWTLEIEDLASENVKDMSGPGTDGFRKLLAAAEAVTDPVTRARDCVILWLLFGLALRRGEVASLSVDDVNLETKRIRVLGKGRSEREGLTMPEQVVEVMRRWLTVRVNVLHEMERLHDAHEQERLHAPQLFMALDRGHYGQRLSTTAIYRLVQAYATVAGIGKVRPHGLRHAGITAALDATDGNIRKVQKFSRHRDVRKIQRYDDNRQDLAGEVATKVADSLQSSKDP